MCWSDVAAFRAGIDAGRYDEALSLYRGDLLDGFFADAAPAFEQWLERTRAHLRSEAARAARALAEQHVLPLGDALRIATEIAGALDYAHRSGIVHCEVKPENILLADGHAVAADFGVARALVASGASPPPANAAGEAIRRRPLVLLASSGWWHPQAGGAAG